MSTCMMVTSLITIKQNPDNKGYVTGSATYRSTSRNYKSFDFKFYNNPKNKDIQPFDEGDIVVLTGKFSYRNDYDGDNPLFLGVNQAISFPRPKKNIWDRDNMPIAHPYVTLTVYLGSNPLTSYMEHKVIKAASNQVFCSYNSKKYDHTFYLYYEEGTRWSKTINAIKKGDIKVHISGYYLGYLPKNNNNSPFFEAIQLTELDFETKVGKYKENDDEEEFIFGSSSKDKRHNTESSDESIFSFREKDRKVKKTKKSEESTIVINSLSYKDPLLNKSDELNKDDNVDIKRTILNDNLSPLPPKGYDTTYTPPQNTNYSPYDDSPTQQRSYPYYNPYFQPPYYPYHRPPSDLPPHPPHPPHSPPYPHDFSESSPHQSINDKTNVTTIHNKDTTNSVQPQNNDDNENNDKKNKKIRGSRGKRGGGRGRGRGTTVKPTTRVLRNKKKGLMDIAVDKIIEISEDDAMQMSDDQKDTEDELEY